MTYLPGKDLLPLYEKALENQAAGAPLAKPTGRQRKIQGALLPVAWLSMFWHICPIMALVKIHYAKLIFC